MIAGNIVVRIGADLSGFHEGMKLAQKTMGKLSKDFAQIGGALNKSITLPAVAAGVGLGKMAIDAGAAADELLTMSAKTGLTVEQLQGMEYASRFVDVELETMTGSMAKLTKTMDAARGGTGAAADAYKTLGVEVTNQDGSLRDSQTVWQEAISALGGVTNETERNALAFQIFGKSAMELNPLIVAGGDALNKYAQEAKDLGITMSQENVDALGQFDDSMQKLQGSLIGARNSVAVALLPALQQIVPIIQDQIVPLVVSFGEKISELITWFANLNPNLQTFILTAGGILIALGPVLLILGQLFGAFNQIITTVKTVQSIFTGLSTMFTLLTGPVGLVILAIGALIAAGVLLYQNWDLVKAKASELADGIKNAFAGVKDFVLDIWDGMKTGIKNSINAIIGHMNKLIAGLNKIKFTIPSKIPGIGGISWGFDLPSIPALAEGGIVTQPTLALIGEAGPEAIVPLDKGGSAAGMNVTVNVRSPFDVTRELEYLDKKLAWGI